MTPVELKVLSAIHADIAETLRRGYPDGRGWASEKIAHDLAVDGIARTRPPQWTGWGMDMTPSQRVRFTRILDRLEKAGYILRLATYSDGLKTHVQLLEAGREALAALAAHQGASVDA